MHSAQAGEQERWLAAFGNVGRLQGMSPGEDAQIVWPAREANARHHLLTACQGPED